MPRPRTLWLQGPIERRDRTGPPVPLGGPTFFTRARQAHLGASCGKLANNEFDPKVFLAKVGAGKTILKFEKNQHVFEQGDVADRFFYIQKGSVKLTVLSEQSYPASFLDVPNATIIIC